MFLPYTIAETVKWSERGQSLKLWRDFYFAHHPAPMMNDSYPFSFFKKVHSSWVKNKSPPAKNKLLIEITVVMQRAHHRKDGVSHVRAMASHKRGWACNIQQTKSFLFFLVSVWWLFNPFVVMYTFLLIHWAAARDGNSETKFETARRGSDFFFWETVNTHREKFLLDLNLWVILFLFLCPPPFHDTIAWFITKHLHGDRL